MIQGLRTAIYFVEDIEKAKAWYTKILERPPYFDTAFYVGYNVEGFELGLHPAKEGQMQAIILLLIGQSIMQEANTKL